jgi:hypothetical protein
MRTTVLIAFGIAIPLSMLLGALLTFALMTLLD